MKTGSKQFRHYLEDEFAIRCERNPSYSLRAFARDLGWSAPRLSMVIRGKIGLSPTAADRLSYSLGWSPDKRQRFRDLVESNHARSKKERLQAETRLAQRTPHFAEVDLDRFRIIADWYHYAIMELTETADFECTIEAVVSRLGITPAEAKVAVRRLFELGFLLMKEGRWTINGNNFANSEGIPSEALRTHHDQLLGRARNALQSQSVLERNFSGVTIAIDPDDLPWVANEIARFRERVSKRLDRGAKKRKVYHLAVQFYGLERKR